MTASVHIDTFWSRFLTESGRDPDTPLFASFRFDDNESSADALAALVLRGKKQATASLLWEYQDEGRDLPKPGDFSIVTNWQGDPVCVIETTRVDICGFDRVDAEFALAEGEGDLSLAYWRDVHWSYFGRVCRNLAREPHRDMPVVCEQFRVVYKS